MPGRVHTGGAIVRRSRAGILAGCPDDVLHPRLGGRGCPPDGRGTAALQSPFLIGAAKPADGPSRL